MSCFIVSKKTIDICVYAAMAMGWKMGRDNYTELGQHLWNMNADAFASRYEEAPEYQQYIYEYPGEVSAIQRFMSLKNLRYQCSCGDITDTELYKKLASLLLDLATKIIAELSPDQWNSAQWEIP